MTVVIDFDGRIDAELDRLFNDRTILAGDAQRDVRLDFVDNAPRVGATVIDTQRHVCGEPWDDRDRDREWRRPHYEVRFDFTIRVPRNAALRLCTINGGDVVVNGTRGDFEVSNVNGLIDMRQVAGSGRAAALRRSPRPAAGPRMAGRPGHRRRSRTSACRT